MPDPIAYLNGNLIAAHELSISPSDAGFMLGITVAEQLRTFGGELFLWDEHAARLRDGLAHLGVEIDLNEIRTAAHQLVEHNRMDRDHDLGLTLFVTPGPYAGLVRGGNPQPTVGMHTKQLAFASWASLYEIGQRCCVVSVPQVDAACWPRALKCRSRMHYFLADREAHAQHPEARAILLDRGYVSEASTANVVAYFADEGLVSPPLESILPGVSLGYLEHLARTLEIPFTYRSLAPQELLSANELLLTSTPFCLLPVSWLGDKQFSERDCFRKLMSAWSERVGVDIVAQAQTFSKP